ncbi:prolyl oligopeptidase family serine peptidase [Pelagibacteraceae bacterium]|nr:prolyl oligopeptidase family serine peptidase [Pelagibacteraceae bacterium]
MKLPQLRKQRSVKKYHGHQLIDDYAWVDQPNVLEVLKKPHLLLPEVREYVEENNKLTEQYFSDVKNLQKELFSSIKGKIKLDDEGLKFRDRNYYYWSKVTKEGQYGKKLRQKIGSSKEEVYFDGDLEKEKHKSEFFSVGDISVSEFDTWCAYSLDLKGSEYYDIYLKNLSKGEEVGKIIRDTSGSITWDLEEKSFFYCRLDKFHRPKYIWKHTLNTPTENDELIFEEKDETFTVGIGLTSDEKWYIISSGDANTTEQWFFPAKAKQIKPKLFKARKKDLKYSIDSWKDGFFYIHTNEKAPDGQILRCTHDNINKLEIFISKKDKTIIGGLEFLDNFIIRSEMVDAIPKILVRRIDSNTEEELIISKEQVGSPGATLMQKNTNTNKIWISWESLATPGKVYEYDIVSKEKKLVKEIEVPSGHDNNLYVVERLKAKSHDGEMIPITLVRRKDSKLDGKSKLVLYGYGSYKTIIPVSFSPAKFCLVDEGITFAIAHVRGGGELGEKFYRDGMMMKKINGPKDYIACCEHLIKQGYTYKGGVTFYGGSAGGTLGACVANMRPELFFAMLLLVPYVDCLTTSLNETLPLTPGEYSVFGNPKKYKEHYEYILSYSPYNNLKNINYSPIFVTSSLFDSRVLYTEPVKYIAKLREVKNDKNIQLLKCKLKAASHGGSSGRDNSITELAEEYSFILKNSGIKNLSNKS